MNKIFRVIWSHDQQAWVVVSELVKSHTKTSACTDKRAQVCTSHYFLDKQQDKFKLSLLSLVLLGIFFSPVGLAAYFQDSSTGLPGNDDGTIGIGKSSKAGSGAITIGLDSTAQENSVVLGTKAKGTNTQTVAIGNLAEASASQSIAIGANTEAKGFSHTKTSACTDKRAQVCKQQDKFKLSFFKFKLSFLSLVLLGIFFSPVGLAAYFQDSSTGLPGNDDGTIGIGKSSKAGSGAITIGLDSTAQENSVVLGTKAKGTNTQTVAIGNLAEASASQSIAIGANTEAKGYGSISIGGDDLKQTIYGGSYFKTTASGKASVAIGGMSLATGEGSIVLGPVASANHAEGIAIGARSSSTAEYGIAVGGSASADGKNAVALGRESRGAGTDSIAIGNSAKTTGADSVVVGANIDVTGEKLVAIGREAKAGSHSTALGYKASAG
ncbi:hep_Hag family protein, partial [Glaesserella parasuis 29755]